MVAAHLDARGPLGRKAVGRGSACPCLASADLAACDRRRSSRARPGVPGAPARARRSTGARVCAPEMAFMFMERNAGTSTIDYPVGGSRAIVDALVRGIRKHGGRVLLRAPVEQILIEGARGAPAVAPSLSPVLSWRPAHRQSACGPAEGARVPRGHAPHRPGARRRVQPGAAGAQAGARWACGWRGAAAARVR